MTYTLDFYYWTASRRAGTPVPVRSESDLERVLAEILNHRQPHPTQVAARELPTFGPAEIPDRMFKIDVAPTGEHAALHYFGPTDQARAVRMMKYLARQVAPEGSRPTSLQIEQFVAQNVGDVPLQNVEVDVANADAGSDLRAWVTCYPDDGPVDVVPALYIDKANQTEFPRNAIIPMDRARLALLEFAETGVRPESVQWQPCDVR